MTHEISDFSPIKFSHEGADLEGQLIAPKAPGRYPGVIVMSSAMGLGIRARDSARELARAGYVAVATDMYGNGARFNVPAEAGPTAGAVMSNPELVRSRTLAWYQALKALPSVDANRVAAIGYCFGGQCVLELARMGTDLKAVISYHGILATTKPAAPGNIKPLVAIYTGAKDPYVPAKDIETFNAEMSAAQARWHLTTFSDAYHSFTSREDAAIGKEGLVYNELADNASWAGTMVILKSVFTA